MGRGGQKLGHLEVLRRIAEDILSKKSADSNLETPGIGAVAGLGELSEFEMFKFLHELQVHQLELEIQNEELLRVKDQAETEAKKYFELYDSSPSGYFTLSKEGKILELNLAAAQMLGKERSKLKNNKFGSFVSPKTRSVFNLFVERVFSSPEKESCELILSINSKLSIDVCLTGLFKSDGEHCFVTMVDISERKLAERELVVANNELLYKNEEKAKHAADLILSNEFVASQRDRLQKITSLVPGVVYQFRLRRDGSSFFPYSSEAIQSMYGVTPEDITEDASAFFSKLHPDDLNGFVASVEKSAKDLSPWQREFRVQFDDGSIRIHSGKGLPQPEEDGSVLWHGIITDITEYRHMEETLHESERQRMDILNDIQDVVWSLSWPDMTIIYLSQSVEKLFGRPVQDFIKDSSLWSTMVHPEDKHISEQAFYQLFKEGSAVRECRIVRPDGTIVWINDRSNVIFDKNNAIIRLDGVTRDITASKLSAIFKEIHHEIPEILNEPRALHDTMQRLLNTLKVRCGFDAVGIRLQDEDDFPYFAQNGFSTEFLFDENSQITRTKEGVLCRDIKGNISFECACGLVISGESDPESPLFRAWGSIWTNDSYPLLSISSDEDPRLHPHNVCIHQGYASVALIPIKNTSRNIGLIQFNDRCKNCFTPDMIDRLEEIAMHIGDVLMRKQAEEELQKSNELLSLFMKHSPIFAFIKEVSQTESRTLKASENYREMIGISGSEMAGKTMFELFPADLAASITADDWLVASEEKQIEIEETLNGRSYSTIKFPITLGGKKLLAGYSMDITERKEADEEILLKNAELQKLNAEKDRFFSIISHDLRSPFQALLGYFPLTMEKIKTYPLEKVQLLLMDMRTASENLYVLVENLLEWSKMQQGLIVFNPSSIQLKEVVSEILVIIHKSADKKMIKINYDIPEHLIVTADRRMLESILNNLITNAVKFTQRKGKVTISVVARPNNYIEISIEDTGIGMNKDMIDSLFLLGADIGHKGTEGEFSSGLGLFICKDFVEKHGGKLWVESKEGEGSIFRFTLASLS